MSKLPEAQPLILKDPSNQVDIQKVFSYLLSLATKPPIKAFIGVSFDEKIRPLINQEQRQKFQALREEMRRRLIEHMTSKALHEAEVELKHLW